MVVALGRFLGSFGCLSQQVFTYSLQIGQLLLGLFILTARLRQGDVGRVEIAARNCAVAIQFFSAVIDFLSGIESGFGRGCIQFGFLKLLRQAGIYRDVVIGIRLFEISL